jgi:hypothetical protein
LSRDETKIPKPGVWSFQSPPYPSYDSLTASPEK